jgi:hypothetical protein
MALDVSEAKWKQQSISGTLAIWMPLTIRLAEKAGVKVVGNSWIWKDKYDPPASSA